MEDKFEAFNVVFESQFCEQEDVVDVNEDVFEIVEGLHHVALENIGGRHASLG